MKNGKPIRPYALLTLHRPSNVDNRDGFLSILAGLEELAKDFPIIFPVHPRTRQRIKDFGLNLPAGLNAAKSSGDAQASGNTGAGIMLTDPLGYLDFLCLMKHAAIVVTDSGGIQEETTCLGIPCVTVRENTERPVTVECGTNIVAGTKKEMVQAAIRRQLRRKSGAAMPSNTAIRAAPASPRQSEVPISAPVLARPSAITCSETVLPVPVAPVTRPWRLASASVNQAGCSPRPTKIFSSVSATLLSGLELEL